MIILGIVYIALGLFVAWYNLIYNRTEDDFDLAFSLTIAVLSILNGIEYLFA